MRREGERRNYVNRLNTWVYIDESKREREREARCERERKRTRKGRQSGDPVRRGERARGLRVGELLGFAIERNAQAGEIGETDNICARMPECPFNRGRERWEQRERRERERVAEGKDVVRKAEEEGAEDRPEL